MPCRASHHVPSSVSFHDFLGISIVLISHRARADRVDPIIFRRITTANFFLEVYTDALLSLSDTTFLPCVEAPAAWQVRALGSPLTVSVSLREVSEARRVEPYDSADENRCKDNS